MGFGGKPKEPKGPKIFETILCYCEKAMSLILGRNQ